MKTILLKRDGTYRIMDLENPGDFTEMYMKGIGGMNAEPVNVTVSKRITFNLIAEDKDREWKVLLEKDDNEYLH